jgi:hypothetical protein
LTQDGSTWVTNLGFCVDHQHQFLRAVKVTALPQLPSFEATMTPESSEFTHHVPTASERRTSPSGRRYH